MPDQSSMHAYLNWTKERIDEMDATLASFEAEASQVKADLKAKADHLVADLKKRRDEFQANAKAQAQAGEAGVPAGAQHARDQPLRDDAEGRIIKGSQIDDVERHARSLAERRVEARLLASRKRYFARGR